MLCLCVCLLKRVCVHLMCWCGGDATGKRASFGCWLCDITPTHAFFCRHSEGTSWMEFGPWAGLGGKGRQGSFPFILPPSTRPDTRSTKAFKFISHLLLHRTHTHRPWSRSAENEGNGGVWSADGEGGESANIVNSSALSTVS